MKHKYPHKHDPFFAALYAQAYQDKADGKKEGDAAKEGLAKLILNSSFGKLMSAYSPLYSFHTGLKITVNGQLMLLMLIEMLALRDFSVVDANTDAVTVIVPDDKYDEYLEVCKEWETVTLMNLDHEYFSAVYQLSCNNYIAIKADSEGNVKIKDGEIQVKCKGTMEPVSGLLKGFEFPIVAIAIKEYFVNGTPLEKTIKEHTDIYDFCMTCRMSSGFKAYFKGEPLQKTNRYYAAAGSKSGFLMRKTAGEQGFGSHLLKSSKVIVFNKYYEAPMEEYNINYQFYLSEAYKIKEKIDPSQLSLF